MNVRDLSIVLRPRSNWEAVDLGTGLAKSYYRDLIKIGFLGFGPLVLLLTLICWWLPLLLPFLIWWLKPLLDRFYLFYLSRRIFGQEVSVRETWGEWKRLLSKGTFPLLTWRRFSFNRGMTMAVSDLENLTGSTRSQRCSVVTRVGGGHAFLITLGGLFLEFVALSTVLILMRALIPQGQEPDWNVLVVWMGQGGVGQTLLTLFLGLSYGVIVILLEPIYLANSFALYLNSRTSQEAWDIELRFRELAMRVAKTKLNTGEVVEPVTQNSQAEAGSRFQFKESKQVLSVFFFLGFGMLSLLPQVQAESVEPQVVVKEVLADEDFTNHVETYKEWVPHENSWLERFNDWLAGREKKDSGSRADSGSGGGLVNGLFQLIGIMALGLLIVFLGILMVHLFKGRSLGDGPREKSFKRAPPKVVMGMDVTPESLPDDLLAQARHYWENGHTRLALSLLYRGALTKFITEQEVVIESSDTESECLTQVETLAPVNLAAYFKQLSLQWMKAAYSQEEVETATFENLCQSWPFERSPR